MIDEEGGVGADVTDSAAARRWWAEGGTVLAAVILTYLVVLYGVGTTAFVVGASLTDLGDAGGALGAGLIWMSMFAVFYSPAIPILWVIAYAIRMLVRRLWGAAAESFREAQFHLASPVMARYWVWLTAAVVGFGSTLGAASAIAHDRAGEGLPTISGWWVIVGPLIAYAVVAVVLARLPMRAALRLWPVLLLASLLVPLLVRWILI